MPGLEISNDGSILIEHRSADIGLSPANSAWMTFFGQFFDHGLDLVTKGGNGTIYIPLEADDPLIAGADHILGNADDLAPELRFMTLTRATPFDANGNPSPTGTESQNTTTPFVDQNQTYTSNASHQVFLREYKFTVDSATDVDTIADSHARNTGRLLNGINGGIATWGEVKEQAATKLGLALNDGDVLDVPQLLVDAYGNFTPGANGYAQVLVNVFENNGATNQDLDHCRRRQGGRAGHPSYPAERPSADVRAAAWRNLDGIPGDRDRPRLPERHRAYTRCRWLIATENWQPDADSTTGNAVLNDGQGHNTEYDNEMLDSHFLTGDGRGNENIGLTAVHTIFHSEHNRLVEANKDTIIASNDATSSMSGWRPGPAMSAPRSPRLSSMPSTQRPIRRQGRRDRRA